MFTFMLHCETPVQLRGADIFVRGLEQPTTFVVHAANLIQNNYHAYEYEFIIHIINLVLSSTDLWSVAEPAFVQGVQWL